MNKRKNERHYLNLLEKDYLKEIISDIKEVYLPIEPSRNLNLMIIFDINGSIK